jgi:hypothetical protein
MMKGATKPAPGAPSPVRDVLVGEVRAAVAAIRPTLAPMQRGVLDMAAGGLASMSEATARELAAGVVRMAAKLAPLVGSDA